MFSHIKHRLLEVLLAGGFLLVPPKIQQAAANDDWRSYWTNYWGWYDGNYRPYYRNYYRYNGPYEYGSRSWKPYYNDFDTFYQYPGGHHEPYPNSDRDADRSRAPDSGPLRVERRR